jgi:hypothetical protein
MRTPILLLSIGFLGCGGGGGGGTQPDAEAAGPSLATPEDVMTWVPFPDTTCGNGTPAGIGVRRTSLSDDLFIYFSGGGACWDYDTCFVLEDSIHIDETYTAATLHTEADGLVFDHTQTANPLSKASIIYVPYCTGDLHAGTATQTYTDGTTSKTVHHTGSTNATQFVAAIKAAFPNAQHLWIVGSSAGGYGVTFNFHLFTNAFPNAEAALWQDSSPFAQPQVAYDTWKTSWNLQFPPGCTGCDASFPEVVDVVAAAHPNARIGLTTYDNDATIRSYFGYASLVAASNSLLDMQYSHPNTKAFMVAGESHTMFGGIGTIIGPGNVPLFGWVNQWIIGDPAWATVRP